MYKETCTRKMLKSQFSIPKVNIRLCTEQKSQHRKKNLRSERRDTGKKRSQNYT
uniref:Ovule protein n=1 Tax=Romanomermis culicivorax TaxID=13658 RepID=A0A915I3D6_ROMCU